MAEGDDRDEAEDGADRPRFCAQAGPQSKFLDSDADIAIYGGAAGGGKTCGIL